VPAPLPRLPPAFRVRDEDLRPGGRRMTDILADDHDRIIRLCDRLRDGSQPVVASGAVASEAVASEAVASEAVASEAVADVLSAVVSRHLSAERQYLYPTLRAVVEGGDEIADRELAEDRALLRALRDLRATPASNPRYSLVIQTVTSRVCRHVSYAARSLFPDLGERCTDNELVRLGNRVEIAQEAAPTRPYPSTPGTPPANKVLDPAIGVVDKIRDALTGRVTWPEDL